MDQPEDEDSYSNGRQKLQDPIDGCMYSNQACLTCIPRVEVYNILG